MVHAVTVRNIYKEFGRLDKSLQQPDKVSAGSGSPVVAALDGVTFEVEEGELFGVLGPSGAGKSTLVRLIATLLLPDKGDIQVFGYNAVKQPEEVQARISRVSGGATFFKKLSAMENLLYCASLYGMRDRETRTRAEEILLRLGLNTRSIYEPMDEQSRGTHQKVSIGCALLSQPRLLLLDEPTTGLDPRSKREVQEVIEDLGNESGLTILLTTQDMDEARNFCERIAILNRGNILALDTPAGIAQIISPGGFEPTLDHVFPELTGAALAEGTMG